MPVKKQTEEMECAYNPLEIGVYGLGGLPTIARVHGFSLDHPYTLTVRQGVVYISGVPRKKPGKKSGNANPARMGETAKKEENNTEE